MGTAPTCKMQHHDAMSLRGSLSMLQGRETELHLLDGRGRPVKRAAGAQAMKCFLESSSKIEAYKRRGLVYSTSSGSGMKVSAVLEDKNADFATTNTSRISENSLTCPTRMIALNMKNTYKKRNYGRTE